MVPREQTLEMAGCIAADGAVGGQIVVVMVRIVFRRDPVQRLHNILFHAGQTLVHHDAGGRMLRDDIDDAVLYSGLCHKFTHRVGDADQLKLLLCADAYFLQLKSHLFWPSHPKKRIAFFQ